MCLVKRQRHCKNILGINGFITLTLCTGKWYHIIALWPFFIYIHRSYTLFWWEEKPFTVGCTAWFFLFIIETLASMFLLTC